MEGGNKVGRKEQAGTGLQTKQIAVWGKGRKELPYSLFMPLPMVGSGRVWQRFGGENRTKETRRSHFSTFCNLSTAKREPDWA
jgi:hypothetical protein